MVSFIYYLKWLHGENYKTSLQFLPFPKNSDYIIPEGTRQVVIV
jgi:hypothetical protein